MISSDPDRRLAASTDPDLRSIQFVPPDPALSGAEAPDLGARELSTARPLSSTPALAPAPALSSVKAVRRRFPRRTLVVVLAISTLLVSGTAVAVGLGGAAFNGGRDPGGGDYPGPAAGSVPGGPATVDVHVPQADSDQPDPAPMPEPTLPVVDPATTAPADPTTAPGDPAAKPDPGGGQQKNGTTSGKQSSGTTTGKQPSATKTTTQPPQPKSTTKPAPAGRNDPAQMVSEIVAATNAQRAANGLGSLSISSCDRQQATSRVTELVRENAFYHLDLKPVLSACSLNAVGENLSLGYTTGTAAVEAWMGSEGHRHNLLGNFTDMGISCQLQGTSWLCGVIYSR